MDAILVFLLTTTSFVSWPAEAIIMFIQPYQLEPEYSSSEENRRRTRGFMGVRSFVISSYEHWKSPDGFFLVYLWKTSSHTRWTWMCVLQRTLVLSKLVEGLLLYTWYFLKLILWFFLFRWGASNYENPWCVDKTSLVVWSWLAILTKNYLIDLSFIWSE